jgi:multicomponent K+:H+ antiporter subunit A
MPITGTLAMVASAAMAGVPLLNGFLSKEMFFAETVYISSLPWWRFGLPSPRTLAGIFAVVYALRFSYDIFFGPLSTDLPREPHEPPIWMRVPVDLLVLACLVVGIFPEISIGWALRAAATPVVGGALPEYSLSPVAWFHRADDHELDCDRWRHRWLSFTAQAARERPFQARAVDRSFRWKAAV